MFPSVEQSMMQCGAVKETKNNESKVNGSTEVFHGSRKIFIATILFAKNSENVVEKDLIAHFWHFCY